jgi:hypothetical protein
LRILEADLKKPKKIDWNRYPWGGLAQNKIDPEVAERDRLEMKKLYQEKSGDYSY